jgi:hypothetical protein
MQLLSIEGRSPPGQGSKNKAWWHDGVSNFNGSMVSLVVVLAVGHVVHDMLGALSCRQ